MKSTGTIFIVELPMVPTMYFSTMENAQQHCRDNTEREVRFSTLGDVTQVHRYQCRAVWGHITEKFIY